MRGPGSSVRSATQADLAAVAALERAVFGAEAYPVFVLRQAFDVHGPHLLVAGAPGEVVGYTLGALGAGSATGWVLSLAVDPAHRGRGYARALSVAVLARLAAAGARRVRLTVDPANVPARALYEALGFVVVADEADYFGPGKRRLVMEREP